jgi:hypothetical protein
MKAFFWVLVVISVLLPAYNLVAGLEVILHNQYQGRAARLETTEPPLIPSGHLGLTGAELSKLDQDVAFAYTDSVRDGYRLGREYSALWLRSLGLDGLLFVSSIVGLRLCRVRRQSPSQA